MIPVNIPNFSNSEIECKCGCGYRFIKDKLLIHLQALRDMLSFSSGYPVRLMITSGCRCKKHNKSVGGVENSRHVTGEAVDVYSPDVDLEQLFSYAIVSNLFSTMILYEKSKFVHLDIREASEKKFWTWNK